jgi:hypothetical protein
LLLCRGDPDLHQDAAIRKLLDEMRLMEAHLSERISEAPPGRAP